MVLIVLIIALFNSFGASDQNTINDLDKRIILEQQLHDYLIEFHDHNSKNAAWLVFQVLNSNIEDDITISALHNLQLSDQSLSPIITCITDEYPNYSLYKSFVFCANIPSLYISYLYEYRSTTDLTKYAHLLDNHNLSNKEKSHLSYLLINSFDFNYSPTPSTIDFLDFYYYDHIFDPENSDDHFLDSFKENNYSNLIKSDKTVLLFNLFNGLFKSKREYDVFRLSQNINDFKDFPISINSMRIFRYISFSSYFSGYYQYDIDLYRGSIIPLSQFFSIEEEMKARLDFGVSLYQIGNLQSSMEQLEKVYDTIDEFEDFRYQSALLNNLGIVYYYNGFFEDYLQLIITGLDLASIHNNTEFEIDFLYNLHIYHKKIENWNVAYDYLHQIDKKVQDVGDMRSLALIYQSYATFYRDSHHDINKSLEYLKLAEYYAREAMYYTLLYSIIAELIDTYSSIGDYDRALYYSHILLEEAVSREDNSTMLFAYIKLANLNFKLNNLELASSYIDIIRTSDVSQLRFSKSQALLTSALAKYEIINNDNNEAIKLLTAFANDLILRIKNSSEIQSGHLIFENEYLSVFHLLIEQLIFINERETAIYWMDEIKNLSSASFYNNPALKASILSESQLVLDFALRNRIERLRHELRTASDEKRVQLNTFLFEAISEQNTLRRKVLQNIDLEPVNLNRLRRQLGRSDIILYFSTFNEDLYVSAISSGSFNIHHITFTEDDISRINEIVKSLSSDKVRLTELAWFKDKIFNKIGVSDRYTNYFIIPDGFLYHIPFEILPVGNVSTDYSYGEATYLIERAAISYSNSLKDLKSSLTHRPKRRYDLDFVGFGITHFINPESQLLPGRYLPALPLAEKEVEEIATNLNRLNNNIFLDSKTATERNLRQKAGNNRILHFATHSEVFENDPLYSVIYLNQEQEHRNSGDASNDGLVYAYELFQLDLSSEMVMLNSCESGSGNYIQGSGIVGFSRAFNYAGVPSLVMNLWSVRDRSAYHLSVSFYDYLNQGYGKNEAMRKAKIDYINKFNSNPTNWGSFVVYGNVDPIVPSRSPWVFAAIILFIGGISLIAAWFRLPGKIKSRLQ